MNPRTTVLALSVGLALVLVGCQPSPEAMLKQAAEVQRQQMDIVAQVAKSAWGFGCVSVQPEPAGAALTVDGAEILGDADSLTIPLGVHEFTARWPDGATATRRIFVPQMEITYDVKYEAAVGRYSGGTKYSVKPDVKKTAIILKKPTEHHQHSPR